MASSEHNVAVTSQSAGGSLPVDAHVRSTTPASVNAANNSLDLSQSALGSHLIGTVNGSDSTGGNEITSAHGSFADADSSRDAASVADALEGNVGSDTDTSRAEGLEQRDANGNIRPLAAKKPTTFKAVSVTKNFLAKTASATPMAKLSEKSTLASSSPLSLARPRLVAKSGSGMRDAPMIRSKPDGTSDGASVWNKNRPAPQVAPKHFTDEELKQQYGIHLASRIQSDETSKAPKWADLDDEEDDWAPEPVEWMDGTKSNLNPEPISAPVQPAPPVQVEAQPAEQRSNMMALKRPVAVGPPKTILRPGAAQLAKQDALKQGDAKGAGASGQSKTPAPVPVKSPWAALPPVDKSVPIVDFNAAPPPTARPSFGIQDARMLDNSSPSFVRHEMEADTFDRAWREPDRGPRELFNSHSGRYEPAPEGRRPSMRQEAGYRQPAVLQRPSRTESSEAIIDGPPASQMRGQMDGSAWSRRRGSSINGPQPAAADRRASFARAGEQTVPPQDPTRSGIVIGHDIGPQARQEANDAFKYEQEVAARNEEIARQKRIMHEKREAAVRRRREEEERAEAEKRERLRLKMESLPPVAAKTANAEQGQTGAGGTKPSEGLASIGSNVPAHSLSPIRQHVQTSPPKQQQTLTSGSSIGAPPGLTKSRSTPAETPFSSASPVRHTSGQLNQHMDQNAASISSKVPLSSYSSPGDQKARPAGFKSPFLGQEPFGTWANNSPGASQGPPASNVWGAPGAHYLIGNGDFGGRGDFASRSGMMNMSDTAGKMADMSGPNPYYRFPKDEAAVQQGRSSSSANRQETSPMRHQQMISDQNMAALGLADTPGENYPASTSTGPSPVPRPAEGRSLPPIGPPPRGMTRPDMMTAPGGPRGSAGAWNHFAANAGGPPDSGGHAGHLGNLQKEQVAKTDPQQQWNETFKQTRLQGNWTGAAREIIDSDHAVYKAGSSSVQAPLRSPLPPVSQTHQSQGMPIAKRDAAESTVRLPNVDSRTTPTASLQTSTKGTPPYATNPSGPAQQSRFFPTVNLGGSPPPEESSHPVFEGDRIRVRVNLPHPKPNVRLPPAALSSVHAIDASPVIMPHRSPPNRMGAQSLVQSSVWQARFNGLFKSVEIPTAAPPSPPKTPPKALAVPASAPQTLSKAHLLDHAPSTLATVSLPNRAQAQRNATPESVTGKPLCDELFEGELSFGSTPKVLMPEVSDYRFGPDRSGVHILRMRPVAKFDHPVDPSTREVKEAEVAAEITINIVGAKRAPTSIAYSFVPKTRAPKPRKASAKFAGKTSSPAKTPQTGSAPHTPSQERTQDLGTPTPRTTGARPPRGNKRSASARTPFTPVS